MNAMDITALAGALTALKGIKDLSEAMIGLRDASAFQEKRIESQSKIIDAQTSIFSAQEERAMLIKRVNDVEKELAKFETWEAEAKRYELNEVAPRVFAHVLKAEAQGAEPSHWICPSCYQKRQKSILQGFKSGMSGWSHRCSSCNLEIYAGFDP
jgi:hypothetical protein